jgi:two-component system, response regulator
MPGEAVINSRHVLLVEDNDDDEELTKMALRKGNITNEVIVARDGAEAIEAIFGSSDEEPELPTLTLLDLKLPKIDGLEVLRRIRTDERTRLMPIVILTASKEQEDVIESYQLGANAYVRKPIDFSRFVEAVRTLGLFWLILNEPPRAQPRRDGEAMAPDQR